MHRCPRGSSPTDAEGRGYRGAQSARPVVGRRKVAAPERKRRGLSRAASERPACSPPEADLRSQPEVDASPDGGRQPSARRRSSGSCTPLAPCTLVAQRRATQGLMKAYSAKPVSVKQAYRSTDRGRRLRGYARIVARAAAAAPQPEAAARLDGSASPGGAATPAAAGRCQAGELSPAQAAASPPQKQHRQKWSGNRTRREATATREAPPAIHEIKEVDMINPWIEPTIQVSSEALDGNLRRRSQSMPGWRTSPTWQVPLQMDLAKADADDWKGMLKEKATCDVGSIKGQTKLEADYSEVNKAYSKGGDNDLDVDYGAEGSDDDIKPTAGRSRVTRPDRFQADIFETKANTGPRTTAAGRTSHAPGAHQPQRQAPTSDALRFDRTEAASKGERNETWPSTLKLRRRARTLGPSERLGTLDLDRGTLRSSRRTLPVGSGPDVRARGSSPFASERLRGAWDRGFGDRSGAWDRRDDRPTSRLRGRSEDSCAFAKRREDILSQALSQSFQKVQQQRPHRPEARGGDFLGKRKLPTWHVPVIGAETPHGTIVGVRVREAADSESDCKAVPEDMETDSKAPGHRSFKASGHEASNRAPSCDSLRGGDGGPGLGASLPGRSMKLRREVRLLLNKISPENEAQILPQMAAIQLEAAEDFKIVAKLIVEKAMSDPFYSEVYARAISKLVLEYNALPVVQRQGQSSGESDSSGGESLTGPWCPKSSSGFANFNDVVLNHCRRTFDKVFDKSEIHNHNSEDDEETLRCRDRAQAFMRLLGHLFKVSILRASILQRCLDVLLTGVPDWQKSPYPPKACIECVCEFLTVAGKALDSSRSTQCKQILKSTLERLERLKDLRTSFDLPGGKGECGHVYPSRIQFLIQDIIEAGNKGFPSNPFDSKGGPAKAKCKMPVRLPQHTI